RCIWMALVIPKEFILITQDISNSQHRISCTVALAEQFIIMISIKTQAFQFVFGIFKFNIQPAPISKFWIVIYEKLKGIICQSTVLLIINILSSHMGTDNIAFVFSMIV